MIHLSYSFNKITIANIYHEYHANFMGREMEEMSTHPIGSTLPTLKKMHVISIWAVESSEKIDSCGSGELKAYVDLGGGRNGGDVV